MVLLPNIGNFPKLGPGRQVGGQAAEMIILKFDAAVGLGSCGLRTLGHSEGADILPRPTALARAVKDVGTGFEKHADCPSPSRFVP